MYNYPTNHETISFAKKRGPCFRCASTRLPPGASTRYIPLVAGDSSGNSGQGSPTESRLHQSLAIRASYPGKFKASAGDGAEDVLGLGAATPSISMASPMATKLTRIQGEPV